MRRLAALTFSIGVLATVYVTACVLPGEPSGAERIQFTLDSVSPYRVPLAGVAAPRIAISADGQPLSSPPYRLETLDAGIVRVDSTQRRLLGVTRGTAAVRVTYLGATGTPDAVFPVQVVISRVAVDSPALAFTRLGATTWLSATAYDANEAAVSNVAFTWSSADPTVATVNDTGFVTAVDEGATTIMAEADGVTDASDVTVTQVAAAVRVTPELDTLRTVGRSIQLVALAFDANNNFLFTAKPHWTSSDTNVARVDAAGRATATGAGTSRIVARVGAAADTATLVVAQVARLIVLTPGFDTLTAIAETTRVVAVVLDSSLIFPIPTPSITWTTSDAKIAPVDATGLVTAAANGVVLVTASSGSQSAFATVVVHQEIAAARISQDSVALTGVGDTVRLSALGLDKNGYPVHTQANPLGFAWSVWHSGSGCVASLPESDPEWYQFSTLVTARGAGETSIIATPSTLGGRPDTATVTVTGAPAGEAEIAYRSNWGIQALCAVGGAQTVLIWATNYFGRLYDFWGPAWSPDGARLAFYGESYYPSLSCGLYIARADGSEVQKISDRCGYSNGSDRPAWSPDGTKLAFSPRNTNNSGQDTIYVVNADGSNLRPLFSFSYSCCGQPVANPTWSPDGTQLAFDAWVFDPNVASTYYIYVMNADGSGAHRLPNTAGGRSPAWSPDGSQLAFGRSDEPGQSDIWLINPDGSGATNLTQGNGAFAMTPAWSPDGSRLVFEGRFDLESNRGQLFVVNRDGTGLQQLDTGDTGGVGASGPTWRRRP